MLGKIGKYEIRGEIGRGAMGAVYEGFDAVIGRRVAIKILRTDVFSVVQLPGVLARFKREAQAAGGLSHPHIVTIHDYGEEGGTPYIVMEYIVGSELGQLLERGSRFSLEEIVRIMTQLLGALSHAHQHGVVHRDLKPANIFLLTDGSIKVVDFGIARLDSSDLTETGTVLGTPAYMSPEQCLGTQVDHRSDVYTAGVILYQLLTGEKPFTGSVTSVIQKVLRQEPLPPSDLNPMLAPGWDGVVQRAMAKQPDARYASAREFAEAIAAAQQGASPAKSEQAPAPVKQLATAQPDPDATVPITPSPAGAKAPPRPRKSVLLPLFASAGLLAGAAALYVVVNRAPAPTPAPAVPVVDEEKIRRATEARMRKEFEDKAAAQKQAERAAAEKAAAAKLAADKAVAAKLAAQRAAADKLAAEKAAAAKLATQRAAADKLAAEKAAAAKLATQRAAADKLAAEKAAAAKLAADKAAAESEAREKRAAEAAAASVASASPAPRPSRPASWSGGFQCEQYNFSPAQWIAVRVEQSGDEFKVSYGASGQPGSAQMSGTRERDGSMQLHGRGISGAAGSYGSDHPAQFSVRFSEGRFEGRGRLGARPCTLIISQS